MCEVREVCVFLIPPLFLDIFDPGFSLQSPHDIPSPFSFLWLLFVVLRSGGAPKGFFPFVPSCHWHKVKYVNLMKKPEGKKRVMMDAKR